MLQGIESHNKNGTAASCTSDRFEMVESVFDVRIAVNVYTRVLIWSCFLIRH